MASQSLPTISDLRALEQFDAVPAGHTGMIVTSDRFAPHLRPGEIAVVNLNDKEPVTGELSVVGITNRYGERELRFVQTVGKMLSIFEDDKVVDRLCWYDRFAFQGYRKLGTADGPMKTENWRDDRCIGRIVGFVAPAWEA